MAAACQLFMYTAAKSIHCTNKLIDIGLSTLGCLKISREILCVGHGRMELAEGICVCKNAG